MVDPDVQWSLSVQPVPTEYCSYRNPAEIPPTLFVFRKTKTKGKTICRGRSREYALTSVSWVRMRVFLYIQNSEAAIWGFSPKKQQKHRCRKKKKQHVHKRSRIRRFVASLSGFFAAKVDQPQDIICRATEVTSLGEVTQSLSLRFATSAHFFWRQHKHPSDSVQQPACHGRQMVGQERVSRSALPYRDDVLKHGQEEDLSSSSPSLAYIMLFFLFFFGKTGTTNIDTDTTMHSPSRGTRWLTRQAVECLERTFRHIIEVESFATRIHATTTRRKPQGCLVLISNLPGQ